MAQNKVADLRQANLLLAKAVRAKQPQREAAFLEFTKFVTGHFDVHELRFISTGKNTMALALKPPEMSTEFIVNAKGEVTYRVEDGNARNDPKRR